MRLGLALAVSVTVAVVSACTSSDSRIAEFERGREVFLQGDAVAAMNIWLPLADAGFCRAEYAIYTVKYHVQANDWEKLGFDWREGRDLADRMLFRAAEHGHSSAQYLAGTWYISSHSASPPDRAYAASIVWLERAASQSEPFAIADLATLLFGYDNERLLMWMYRSEVTFQNYPAGDAYFYRKRFRELQLELQLSLSIVQIERAKAAAEGWRAGPERAAIESGCYAGTDRFGIDIPLYWVPLPEAPQRHPHRNR